MANSVIIATCTFVFVYSAKVTSESSKRQFECGADFSCLVKATAFVDKTLFIYRFLQEDPKSVLIIAPKCFGKSTNVDMLKRFLEIEVDEQGTPKTNANYTRDPVTDTANYEMFVRDQLAITKHAPDMEDHLGRHPVISVDFRCGKVKSYNDSVDCCRRAVHSAFLQHKYLLLSRKLNDQDKRVCKQWCDNSSYSESSESEVRAGLNVLSGLLYKHFKKRKVYVLIDEYDYVMTSAMFEVEDESVVHKIMKFNVGVLADVLESYNNSVVAQGLLTGVAYIDGMDWYSLSNIVKCRFLEIHPFTDFYGVSRGEINSLFTKPEFTLDLNVEDARQLTKDGFTVNSGRRVYSYRSMLT